MDITDDCTPMESTAEVPGLRRSMESELDDAVVTDPWDREYRSELCGFREPTIRDKVYTFLTSSSTAETRIIASETKTKQVGVKNSGICLLMQNGQKAVSRGEADWDTFFQGRFRRFWSAPKNQSLSVRVALTEEQIAAYAPGVRGRTSTSTTSLPA